MRKSLPAILNDPPPPSGAQFRALLAVVAGLAVSPVVYESALVCVANWRGMSGEPVYARTPVLDAFGEASRAAGQTLSAWFTTFICNVPWAPETVIGFACAWAALGGLLLRSRLRR